MYAPGSLRANPADPVPEFSLTTSESRRALELDSSGTSQHLGVLRRLGVLESRKEGTSVFYRVADDEVFRLLESARAIIARRLSGQQSLLEELEKA